MKLQGTQQKLAEISLSFSGSSTSLSFAWITMPTTNTHELSGDCSAPGNWIYKLPAQKTVCLLTRGFLNPWLTSNLLVSVTSLTKSINWLRQEERIGETQPEIDRKIDIQKPCAAATTTDIEVSCTVYNGVKIFNKLHSNFEKTNSFTRHYRKLKTAIWITWYFSL